MRTIVDILTLLIEAIPNFLYIVGNAGELIAQHGPVAVFVSALAYLFAGMIEVAVGTAVVAGVVFR